VRLRLGTLGASVLVVTLAAAGCSKTTNSGNGGQTGATQTGSVSYDPADNNGPAKPVPGATKGGIVTILQNAEFEHLDPQKNYVNIEQMLGLEMYRSLTAFKEDGTSNLKLVGDLAVDPGTDVNKDCKTWKFTLKDGVKYEDGSTVTGTDVAYGVARSFDADFGDGPTYIQSWLANDAEYNKVYKGPYAAGSSDIPPGVTADAKTITFTFAKPHCDMPFAAALPTTVAVPKAKDTKAAYDLIPFSSGPYRIMEHKSGETLTLARNQYWDPKTDPIRTAYPDGFKFEFGADQTQITQRLVADTGADQTALTWGDCTADLADKCTAPDVKARSVSGPTSGTWVLNINMQRLTDLSVRKALNVALDKRGILQALGGDLRGTVATTLMSPTTSGFKAYNAFPGVADSGDPTQAKTLLAGKTPTIVYAVRTGSSTYEKVAAVVKESLEKAGFKVVLSPVDRNKYYTSLGTKANPYDLYLSGWGSDWPTGSTIIPPLYDGRTIRDKGNQNYSYVNDPTINSEIDRISALPAAQQDSQWMALDQKIMTDIVPVVPVWYDATFELRGSKLGGTFLSSAYGLQDLNTVFVKS
jgi:peptide/nickel transport system substrate-binding protein